MSGLFSVFLVWCVIAVPFGFALAKAEQRKKKLRRPRVKSAILLSVFLGPIGWIWLAIRAIPDSNLSRKEMSDRYWLQQRQHAEQERLWRENGGPGSNY